jgi:hypothetical protein
LGAPEVLPDPPAPLVWVLTRTAGELPELERTPLARETGAAGDPVAPPVPFVPLALVRGEGDPVACTAPVAPLALVDGPATALLGAPGACPAPDVAGLGFAWRYT